MKTLHRWAVLAGTCVLAAGSDADAAEDSLSSAKFERLVIVPDTILIKPGEPLSTRALVTHPPAVRGALSWTVESRRHRGSLYGAAPSPNGQLAATCGLDGTVRIWKLDDGQLLRIMLGHDTYSGSVTWSPCGTAVASTGTWDGTVRVWDPKAGRQLRVFKGLKNPVGNAAWSPDGRYLVASAGYSGTVWIWDTRSNIEQDLLEVGRHILGLVWSPDSKTLAILAQQTSVALYDLETRKATKSFGVASEQTTAAAWSPDSRRLAAGSNVQCTVWDVAEEKAVQKLPGACVAAAWSPDGKQLAAATANYAVQIWDVDAAKVATRVPVTANRLVWHPAGRPLICGYTSHFSVVDPAEGKVLRTVDAAVSNAPYWSANRPIVTGLSTAKLTLWDATTAKRLHDLAGHAAAVSAVSWSRDGKTLASASADTTVRLWDAATGEARQTLKGHTAAVTDVAWAPNGKLLASAGTDKTVRLWDPEDETATVFEGHTGPVRALTWSPAGNQLLSGGTDQRVLVWDPKTRKSVRTLEVYQVIQALACTTLNNTLLVACGTTDEMIRILNVANGQTLVNLRQAGSPPTVSAVAWVPVGARLFAGRGNHTAQLWDVAANRVIHNLATMAPVVYTAVAGNGTTLVAGNSEGTVRFWDTESGQLRGVVLDDGEHVVLVGFDGNCRTESSEEPGLIYVALTPDGQLTLTAKEFATRFAWRNNPARIKLVGGR